MKIAWTLIKFHEKIYQKFHEFHFLDRNIFQECLQITFHKHFLKTTLYRFFETNFQVKRICRNLEWVSGSAVFFSHPRLNPDGITYDLQPKQLIDAILLLNFQISLEIKLCALIPGEVFSVLH